MKTQTEINAVLLRVFNQDPYRYMDCGELNSTLLAENTQQELDVMTDEGNSEVEQLIFDLAVKFEDSERFQEFIGDDDDDQDPGGCYGRYE